jgi:hypothetical protein
MRLRYFSNAYIYRVFVILVGVMFFCGSTSQSSWGAPTIASSRAKGFDEVYFTAIPQQIRVNFNEALQTHKSCPGCSSRISGGEDNRYIFDKKFIVIGVSSNKAGGLWAYIAVENDADNAYRLWLRSTKDRGLDLRSIDKMPGCLDKELVVDLWDPWYDRYWK